jgi:NAD(P)-dependent dehydrogenase (short-subunit alcohol dehydrogenase family)
MSRSVLITGASAGFGYLMSKALLERGHTVVATMRDIQGRNASAAEELIDRGAHVIELDVTSDASVEHAMRDAIRAVGTLQVVVNNAGVGVLGYQESFTIDDFRKLFDINVFGVQRVLRAAIPHLRENGEGTIINVSSILGRISVPYYGPYIASKWALEGLTENYRAELAPFGIRVCIVEPGGFPTSFMERLMSPSDGSREDAYKDVHPKPQEFFQSFEMALKANPQQNPQDVADAVVGIVESPAGQVPFRTLVDRMGMGEAIQGYNDALATITAGIHAAFGIK